METSAGPRLPEQYASWQRSLERAFFSHVAGTPVILFVDDDELRGVAATAADPAKDLSAAVVEVVDPRRGPRMFDSAARLARTWDRGRRDRPPPVLPILALSCLAATRMHTDAHVRSHNYYFRLAQALLPDAELSVTRQTQETLRSGAFVPVADMWVMLHQWLAEQDGAAGISTIRDHPRQTRIGFPLSQAMIRRSDRAVLTKFFAAMKLTELGVPDSDALIDYLRLWASRPRGFSASFQRVLLDAELRPLLQSVLAGLAANWDGHVVSTEGLVRREAIIVLDLERWSTEWAVVGGPDTEPDVVHGAIAGTTTEIGVNPDPYSSFARITGAPPVTPQAVRRGFRLRGARCTVEFPPSPMLVMREHVDAAGWVSGGSVEPFTEHVITAAAELSRDVERALATAADADWRKVQQPSDMPLLSGFAIYHGIRFSDPGRLDEALRAAPDVLRGSIRPDTTPRARLVNGLAVAARAGRHHYLAGGEPDLLLPVGEQPRTVSAALDSVPQQPPFNATGFPIPLRRIGPLPPGEHVIEADREVLRFAMLAADPATGAVPGTGELGWDDGVLRAGRTAGRICGADCPAGERTEPILLRRRTREAWLLARSGRCVPMAESPAISGHLAEAGIGGYYYEVIPAPDHAWVAEERRGRWLVRPLRRVAPEFTDLDAASHEVWERILPHGPADDELWQLYRRAWERARGR